MSALCRILRRLALGTAGAALLATGWQALAPARAQSDDVSSMTAVQLVDQRCSACHGADGNSTDVQFPKLAGQTVAYLAAQLDAFRTGARASDVMAPMAKDLTDAQIVALARYFGRQPAKPDRVKDVALARRGERVFFTPRRGIPPCAACHSGGGRGTTGMMHGQGMMGGMGMMAGMGPVPSLDGQHAGYIVTQLDAFAKGTRPATVMHAVAVGLGGNDRKAVAEYLSGLR